MEKKNFIKLVLGVVGGLLFSLGMCMVMVFEGMMIWDILVGIVGIVLLLFLIPMCFGFKKAEEKEGN